MKNENPDKVEWSYERDDNGVVSVKTLFYESKEGMRSEDRLGRM